MPGPAVNGDAQAVAMTSTPTALTAGRYDVTVPRLGHCSFEVSPTGAAWFITPAKKYRSWVRYVDTRGYIATRGQFITQFDGITVVVEAATGDISVAKNNGPSMFTGVLDPAQRSG